MGYLNGLNGRNDKERLAELNRRTAEQRRRQKAACDAEAKRKRLVRKNNWR
jgi:hypothetical protein